MPWRPRRITTCSVFDSLVMGARLPKPIFNTSHGKTAQKPA
jgi:hypothetical protein